MGLLSKRNTHSIWYRAFHYNAPGFAKVNSRSISLYIFPRVSLSNYYSASKDIGFTHKFREDLHPSSFILQHLSSINRSATLFCHKSCDSFSRSLALLLSCSRALQFVCTRDPSAAWGRAFVSHNWTWLTPNVIHFPLTALYPSYISVSNRNYPQPLQPMAPSAPRTTTLC